MGAAGQRAGHHLVRGLGRRRRGGLRRFAKSRARGGPARQRAGSDQRRRHGVRRRGRARIGASTNNANGASALSYIPETTWNDSAEDGTPSASGGGASVLFSKPSWQTGPGVPSDNARHVPDVSLNASADHDGYLVYTGGSLQVYGGTSVPAPSFRGDHGAAESVARARAAWATSIRSCMRWRSRARGCFTTSPRATTLSPWLVREESRTAATTPVGYYAGVGYDQATGLGSVDAYKLVTGWNGGSVYAAGESGNQRHAAIAT